MADVYTRIGYIKGDPGAKGDTGSKGDTGEAATIEVGSVTTVPYGQTANVVNSGTEQAAVFDFTIPQGRPGQQVTEMDNLLLNSITTSAAEFPLPAVGETGKVLWGKVVKWFSDMAALVATKFNAANVVNNLTTTASGYALDARQGKVLNDEINYTSTGVGTNVTSLGNYDSVLVRHGNTANIYARTWGNTANINSGTVMFTLPNQFVPNNTQYITASVVTNEGNDRCVPISIDTSGNVKLMSSRTYQFITIIGTYVI